MIVGYGNNNVLLLGLVEGDIDTLHSGLTITFEGVKMLTKDVIVVYARLR